MRTIVTMAAAMALMAGGAEARPKPETISYETGACHGTCPVYKVTVSSDGRGVFDGQRFTAVTGTRAFRVTPAQWREFRRRLQPLHGHGRVDMTDQTMCTSMTSDLPTVEVRWSGATRPFTLRADYGCDMDRHAAIFRRLRTAPDALPIARLVKPAIPFPPSR